MGEPVVKLGTRGSPLALAQAYEFSPYRVFLVHLTEIIYYRLIVGLLQDTQRSRGLDADLNSNRETGIADMRASIARQMMW